MSDRYIAAGRPLSPHERELATILIEECAEISIAMSKALRFGRDDRNPETKVVNTVQLGWEIGDFFEVMNRLVRLGLINPADIAEGTRRKARKLERYLQTEEVFDVGTATYRR